MLDKSDKQKQVTDSLLEKSKALREKSKATETKFNQLKARLEEFIHPEKPKDKQDT